MDGEEVAMDGEASVPGRDNVIILKREQAHGAPQTHPAHPPVRPPVINLVYHLDEQLQIFTQ